MNEFLKMQRNRKFTTFKKKIWGFNSFFKKLIESFRLNYNVSFVPNNLFTTLCEKTSKIFNDAFD